jgi:hypothetical protein
MGQVLVRNLDNRVIESLRTKAELKGRSLEQELRDVVTKAAPLTPKVLPAGPNPHKASRAFGYSWPSFDSAAIPSPAPPGRMMMPSPGT